MRRKTIWLLVLILIIAAFLRIYQLKSAPPGLFSDEAVDGKNALEAISPGGHMQVFYPDNNGREGLFMDIQALFIKFTGITDAWVLRLPSVIFGILTVLGLYFLVKKLFEDKISFYSKPSQPIEQGLQSKIEVNRRGQTSESLDKRSGLRKNEILALLSSFLLATSFWHINFSRIGFRAIMAPFFLTWTLFLLIKLMNQVKNKSQITSTKLQTNFNEQNSKPEKNWSLDFGTCILSVLAGLIYGLGFYTYIAYRATPLLILGIMGYCFWKNPEKRKQIFKFSLLFIIVSILVFLPLGYYFIAHPGSFFGRTSEIAVTQSSSPIAALGWNAIKTLGMFNFAGDFNWRHNYAGRPELFWPVGILFVLGIATGIRSLFKRRNQLAFIVLFSWFILALLPVAISNEGIPHALRAILAVPVVVIFAAYGGIASYNTLKKIIKTFWLPAFAVIFLSLLVFQAYTAYFVLWAKNPNVAAAFDTNYYNLGKTLNSLPVQTPKYVVFPDSALMAIETTQFITDTFTPEAQNAKNIHYVRMENNLEIPQGAMVFYTQ